jgi:hypothetical protein
MKKIIRLTESNLVKLIKKIINETNDDVFHKKSNENGIMVSVKEFYDGAFELYINDENENFNDVYKFDGDKGLANGVFIQAKLYAQDKRSGKKVFKIVVDKLKESSCVWKKSYLRLLSIFLKRNTPESPMSK